MLIDTTHDQDKLTEVNSLEKICDFNHLVLEVADSIPSKSLLMLLRVIFIYWKITNWLKFLDSVSETISVHKI